MRYYTLFGAHFSTAKCALTTLFAWLDFLQLCHCVTLGPYVIFASAVICLVEKLTNAIFYNSFHLGSGFWMALVIYAPH